MATGELIRLVSALAGPASRFLVVGGTRVSINKVLVPKASTWDVIRLQKPSPADKTKITVVMPMTMPKVVNAVRALLERRFFLADLNALNIISRLIQLTMSSSSLKSLI